MNEKDHSGGARFGALIISTLLACGPILANRVSAQETPSEDAGESGDDLVMALNKALQKTTIATALTNLNLGLKFFNATGSDGDSGLGLHYDYNQPLVGRPLGSSGFNLAFEASAKGNVAFDQDKNPNDFLESSGSLRLFGGRVKTVDASDADTAASGSLYDRVMADPDAAAEYDGVLPGDTRQVRWYDLSADFTLESNQDFSDVNYAYSVLLGARINDYQPDGLLSRLNVLDYPFAAVRWLTNTDESFSPSGQALPSFIAGVGLVDPQDNDARLAIDADDDMYTRFRGEVGFKTVLAKVLGREIDVSATYRYFREFDASNAIRGAKLDEFSYVAFHAGLPSGVFVSYASGNLPLDSNSDNVVALGWKYKF